MSTKQALSMHKAKNRVEVAPLWKRINDSLDGIIRCCRIPTGAKTQRHEFAYHVESRDDFSSSKFLNPHRLGPNGRSIWLKRVQTLHTLVLDARLDYTRPYVLVTPVKYTYLLSTSPKSPISLRVRSTYAPMIPNFCLMVRDSLSQGQQSKPSLVGCYFIHCQGTRP